MWDDVLVQKFKLLKLQCSLHHFTNVTSAVKGSAMVGVITERGQRMGSTEGVAKGMG